MKRLIFLTVILLANISHAYSLYEVQKKPEASTVQLPKSIKARRRKPASSEMTKTGGDVSRQWSMIGEGQITIVNSGATDILKDLKVGEITQGQIPMSVMAFHGGTAPVVANIKSKSGVDYRVLGDATVEKNSKRISIEFKKLRVTGSDQIFDFKAQAIDQDGTYGLEGEVHSGKTKFFLAELLSAAAAAFTDGSINRPVNALGNQYEENSLDTQSKKALSGALGKSGEHFAEEMKQDPEYVTVDGPVSAHLIILEMPKRHL